METFNMFIMGKKEGQRIFRVLRMSDKRQVSNLLYATIFKSDKLEQLKSRLDNLAKENPDWQFKIVKVGTSKILYKTEQL